MNDEKFIELGKDFFTGMALGQSICDLSDIITKLRLYIYCNHDNENVRYFILTLLDFNLELFKDEKLKEALALPDTHLFYKQMRICKYLPYNAHREFAYFLPELLQIDSKIFGYWYRTFMYLLEKYNPKEAKDPTVQQVLAFTEANPALAKIPKDEYKDIDEEIKLYNKAKNGEYFPELRYFANFKREMDEDKVRYQYMNKRIGNIGEIYSYDLIAEAFEAHFASRDVGDGLGYDIIFIDDEMIEALVEVKTTQNTSDDDFFTMSENEYSIMISTLTNKYAKYIISRVVLDPTLRNPSFHLLQVADDKTLIDINNKDIIYTYSIDSEGKIRFTRQTPKRTLS